MTAQQLIEILYEIPEEERKKLDVFSRLAHEGVPFNVKTFNSVTKDTYSFFGKSIPCLILEDVQDEDDE